MQIQSAYSSGIVGLQTAQSGLTQATIDVAKPDNLTPADQSGVMTTPDTNKVSALLSANESSTMGEASTKVLETVFETLGSIIDVRA